VPRGQVNFRNVRRIRSFSLADFDTLSHSLAPRARLPQRRD
jgi:hypothetical protein